MSVESFVSRSVGAKLSFARSLTVAFFTCLGVVAVTGLGLSFSYAPSTASAWASVFFTEYMLAGGFYLRSLHMVAAEGAVVLGVAALAVTTIEGRYRGDRGRAFFAQAASLAVVLGACISGNPLRWDNRGYFGLLTETNIAGEMPGGGVVRALMLGGSVPNDFTLTRLYAVHALLIPLGLAVIMWVWSKASTQAGEVERDGAAGAERTQLTADVAFAAVAAVSLFALAVQLRAPLEAPADGGGSYNARPEWYFVSLYVLRNAVPPALQGPIAGGLPFVAAAIIALLPRLDGDATRGFASRLPRIAPLLGMLLTAAVLTVIGLRHDEADAALKSSRAAQAVRDKRALQVALSDGIPPDGALPMLKRDPISRGEDLFKDQCATCHQLGNLGPADGKLTAPSLDGFGTEGWALAVLKNPDAPKMFGGSGYKGKMPSMVIPPTDAAAAKDWKAVPEEDLKAMAQFLAAEATGGAGKQHERGATAIKRRCTSCHLFRGETDDADGLGPELAGWGSLAWVRAQIANPGTNATYRASSMSSAIDGHMPRYDEKLSAEDIDLLARFVWSRGAKSTVTK